MESYPHEIPSPQLDSAARQSKIAEIPSKGYGDVVDYGQRALRLHTENPQSRMLFRHLIGTALLAAITAVLWLSLIGLVPGAYPHSAAHTDPTELPPTSAPTSPKHQK